MIARRSFFRATVAAPLAAKAAVDEAVGSAAGLNGGTLGAPLSFGYGNPANINGQSADPRPKILSWLKRFGIPTHDRERIWEECRYVNMLDPDLAAKRSWSMGVKIATQRRRNYDRRLAGAMKQAGWNEARRLFTEKSGFEWWF